MSKITYSNKIALNVNSDIADVNKCNASDLNEIKNVVNTNDDNTTNNSNAIGNLSSLNTTNKSNLVSAINEVNTNDIRRSTYSTGEQVIGKWINGKPLYRKTLTFNKSLSSGANAIAHNISNADVIFPDVSFCFFASSNRTTSIPCLAYNTSFTDRVALEVDKTNIILTCDSEWGTTWTKNVTILYTKTTD